METLWWVPLVNCHAYWSGFSLLAVCDLAAFFQCLAPCRQGQPSCWPWIECSHWQDSPSGCRHCHYHFPPFLSTIHGSCDQVSALSPNSNAAGLTAFFPKESWLNATMPVFLMQKLNFERQEFESIFQSSSQGHKKGHNFSSWGVVSLHTRQCISNKLFLPKP